MAAVEAVGVSEPSRRAAPQVDRALKGDEMRAAKGDEQDS